MSKDTIILIILAAVLAVAGIAVFYILGRDTQTGFVPADESFIEAEIDEAAKVKRNTGTGETLVPIPGNTSRRREGPSEVATTQVGEEDTGIRGVVRDPAGKTVGKAVVILFEDKSDIATIPLQGKFVGSVETDDAGAFFFRGLVAGLSYMVRAEHENFASASKGAISIDEKQTVDVVIGLEKGVALRGEVLDDGGNPLEGATVLVVDQQARALDPTEQIERELKTGPDGKFEFPHINPGYKQVTAWKDGYATVTQPSVFLNPDSGAEYLTFRLGLGVVLVGIVEDEAGAPIADAIISAEPMNRRPDRNVVLGNYPPVKSGEDGRFAFLGVKEGAYRLTVIRTGYQMVRRSAANTGPDPVRIQMRRTAVVRGRVLDAETGEPVEKFKLTIGRQPEVVFTPSQQLQFFKSEDGTFEYGDATAKGDFYIHAVSPGYAWTSSALLQGDGSNDIEGVEIRLVKGGVVVGKVVDSDGKAVAGASVELLPELDLPDGGQAVPFVKMLTGNMKRAKRVSRTDGEGRYRFELVQRGAFVVRATHSDFSVSVHERATAFAGTGEAELPKLVMLRGATIVGVVAERDGKSGANCLVRISPKAGFGTGGTGESYEARSDADGNFRVTNVQPGIYFVDVTERGGEPGNFLADIIARRNRQEIIVGDGDTAQVRLD
ncbi:MAG: carboxypeptidase-like regulatory domain-containing protein [Planctomycetota bacterium]